MEEERSRLQEVMGKMEARLGEQSRLLEQVGPVLLPLLRGLSPQHWAAVLCPGLLGAFPVSPAPSCLCRGSRFPSLQKRPQPTPSSTYPLITDAIANVTLGEMLLSPELSLNSLRLFHL